MMGNNQMCQNDQRAGRPAAPEADRIPSGDRPTYSPDEGLHS